jgi:hypothetical protein
VKSIFEFDYNPVRYMSLADKLLVETYIEGLEEGLYEPKNVSENVNLAYYSDFENRKGAGSKYFETGLLFESLASEHKDLVVLDRMHYICNPQEKQCFAINENLEKYIYDYAHQTLVGAEYFGKVIDRIDWLAPLRSK